MSEKYKLRTDLNITVNEKTLYRIEALKDFGNVKAGELGGYVENQCNLSQFDNCWIYDNAMVFGDARVIKDALVYDNAQVFESAQVFGEARVSGNAQVLENAQVFGYAQVFGKALVLGDAQVYESAKVSGSAQLYGYAQVFGNALVCGGACVRNFDEIDYTPISISGFSYTITVTLTSINIGCKSFTIDEIDSFGELAVENGLSTYEGIIIKLMVEAALDKLLGTIK